MFATGQRSEKLDGFFLYRIVSFVHWKRKASAAAEASPRISRKDTHPRWEDCPNRHSPMGTDLLL